MTQIYVAEPFESKYVCHALTEFVSIFFKLFIPYALCVVFYLG